MDALERRRGERRLDVYGDDGRAQDDHRELQPRLHHAGPERGGLRRQGPVYIYTHQRAGCELRHPCHDRRCSLAKAWQLPKQKRDRSHPVGVLERGRETDGAHPRAGRVGAGAHRRSFAKLCRLHQPRHLGGPVDLPCAVGTFRQHDHRHVVSKRAERLDHFHPEHRDRRVGRGHAGRDMEQRRDRADSGRYFQVHQCR